MQHTPPSFDRNPTSLDTQLFRRSPSEYLARSHWPGTSTPPQIVRYPRRHRHNSLAHQRSASCQSRASTRILVSCPTSTSNQPPPPPNGSTHKPGTHWCPDCPDSAIRRRETAAQPISFRTHSTSHQRSRRRSPRFQAASPRSRMDRRHLASRMPARDRSRRGFPIQDRPGRPSRRSSIHVGAKCES